MYVTSKTLLQESKLHKLDLCKTTQHENMCNLYWCILASTTSPAAMVLSILYANVAICNLTEWLYMNKNVQEI